MKIPLRYHVRLHSLKILTGRQISDVVTEAIGDYIDEVEDELGALDGIPPGPR